MGSINCKEYKTSDCGANKNDNVSKESSSFTMVSRLKEPEFKEMVVCNADDLEENEMKQFDFLADTKILMIKQKGKIMAVGANCTHYGAPLHKGVLGEGRVRCPWHGACFSLETGDIEDFPGLDSLPCYKTEIQDDGGVKVYARKSDLESSKRIKEMVPRRPRDPRCFIIIGGGPSAAVCAETLRQEGFPGRIVMISKDSNLPYDRVKLSKSLDIAAETIQLRDEEFYGRHDIEFMLKEEVVQVDNKNKEVKLASGASLGYNKLFIATGGSPIRPPIPGANLKNVFTLREHGDAGKILAAVKRDTHVVCLGSSFISLEVAAYLAGKVSSVSVVARDNLPLKASFGETVGENVMKLFEQNGVKMIMNSGIQEIIGNAEEEVTEVRLKDDKNIPCTILILGTGTRPNTEFLKNSGVMLNPNGSINTDMHLMTNIPDIYVGGDIANAPVFCLANQRATIGHYQLAQYHGRIAAQNMVDKIKELRAVPYFFTMFFGKGLRYSGYGAFVDVHIEGDFENMTFTAYYLDASDNVIAVASCNRDPVVATFAELQYQGRRLTLSDIKNAENPYEWMENVKRPICSEM